MSNPNYCKGVGVGRRHSPAWCRNRLELEPADDCDNCYEPNEVTNGEIEDDDQYVQQQFQEDNDGEYVPAPAPTYTDRIGNGGGGLLCYANPNYLFAPELESTSTTEAAFTFQCQQSKSQPQQLHDSWHQHQQAFGTGTDSFLVRLPKVLEDEQEEGIDEDADTKVQRHYVKYWNSRDKLPLLTPPLSETVLPPSDSDTGDMRLPRIPWVNHHFYKANLLSTICSPMRSKMDFSRPNYSNSCARPSSSPTTSTVTAMGAPNPSIWRVPKRFSLILLSALIFCVVLNSLLQEVNIARHQLQGEVNNPLALSDQDQIPPLLPSDSSRAPAANNYSPDPVQRETDTSERHSQRRLPHVIIVGARKCGTRALIDMLNLHPQVEKAPNEVHFFDRDDNYSKGLDWYRSLMPETTSDQIGIEKSPSYFVTPEVPERIYGMNSSIKLLLIVREPVTRVISDYTQIYGTTANVNASSLPPQSQPPLVHFNKSAPSSNSNSSSFPPRLEDLVLSSSDGSVNLNYKAIRISLYSRYLQRWLDVFPLSQIHVIDGEALIHDPFPVLKDVESFLGLRPALQQANFYYNATKGFYCWRKLDTPSDPSFWREESISTSTTMTTSTKSGPSSSVAVFSPSSTIGTSPSSSTNTTTSNLHCLNESKGRPHPTVDKEIVRKLRQFYSPHNLHFYDMVGKDFGWPQE